MKKYYLLLFLVSIIALWPFLRKGYFETHDGTWMMIRASAFHQALTTGQFPVRFVDRLNNNYGYPVMNFTYPLPFYLQEVPKALGFSYETNYKLVFVFSTILSSLLIFWALSQRYSKQASLAGSILYLYTPYRFLDLYVRGSIGESVAFAVLPLVLGFLFKVNTGKKIYLPLLAISTALLVLSHNVIAVFFLPLFIFMAVITVKNGKLTVLLSIFLGLLISAYFWIPAIHDLKFVNAQRIEVPDISKHLVSPFNLLNPQWGYGPIPNTPNGLSTQVGIVSFLVVIIAAIMQFRSKFAGKLIATLMIIFAVSIFLMTTQSKFLWINIPYIDVIQFPWRLLSVTTFIAAVICAYLVDLTKKKTISAGAIIAASILLTVGYTAPNSFLSHADGFYATNEDPTAIRDEYLPKWVTKKPDSRADQKIVVANGEIISQQVKPNFYKALISTTKESLVTVNTVYFPGHFVKIGNKKTEINFSNSHGLITFFSPKGINEVVIKYGKTPVHLISEIVSLLALVGTGGYLFILWRKRQNS